MNGILKSFYLITVLSLSYQVFNPALQKIPRNKGISSVLIAENNFSFNKDQFIIGFCNFSQYIAV